MNKATIKLMIAVAGIVALGQSCAKDMTTQDFSAELTAENIAKMQVHAGTYQGALKNAQGETVAPFTATVNVQTVSPGASNNASQNVGFGGTLQINIPGQPALQLEYNGANFDFSDKGNYGFATGVTMEDKVSTDTIQVSGQFPDSNTMNGTLFASKNPEAKYILSFSLTRNGPLPVGSSLSAAARPNQMVLVEGGQPIRYVGTEVYKDGTTYPAEMLIEANLGPDQAFYAFISPWNVVNIELVPQALGGLSDSPLAFNNVQLDLVHGVFDGPASNTVSPVNLNCVQPTGSDSWTCSTELFDATFTPSNN